MFVLLAGWFLRSLVDLLDWLVICSGADLLELLDCFSSLHSFSTCLLQSPDTLSTAYIFSNNASYCSCDISPPSATKNSIPSLHPTFFLFVSVTKDRISGESRASPINP